MSETPPSPDVDSTFDESPRRLSEAVRLIRELAREGPVSLAQMLVAFGQRGHAFLVLFLSLPFLQPIPLVGISTIIGLAIGVIGVHLFMGRPPRLPRRLGAMHLPSDVMLKVCSLLERTLSRMEKVIMPRAHFVHSPVIMRHLNGGAVAAHGLLLALPLPVPFSNFFPAVSLLLIGLGLLEQDGLVLLLGYLAGLFNIAFFGSLILLPILGLQWTRFS